MGRRMAPTMQTFPLATLMFKCSLDSFVRRANYTVVILPNVSVRLHPPMEGETLYSPSSNLSILPLNSIAPSLTLTLLWALRSGHFGQPPSLQSHYLHSLHTHRFTLITQFLLLPTQTHQALYPLQPITPSAQFLW